MSTSPGYRTYGVAWLILLGLTLGMVGMGSLTLPRTALVAALAAAMLAKAAVIGGWFMHLKSERFSLVLLVAASALLTGALLFGVIAVDGHAAAALGAIP